MYDTTFYRNYDMIGVATENEVKDEVSIISLTPKQQSLVARALLLYINVPRKDDSRPHSIQAEDRDMGIQLLVDIVEGGSRPDEVKWEEPIKHFPVGGDYGTVETM